MTSSTTYLPNQIGSIKHEPMTYTRTAFDPSDILNPGRGTDTSAHIESTACPCDTANRYENRSRRQARTAPQRGGYRPRVASSDRDPFSHRTGRHPPLGYVASGKPSRSAPIARWSHRVCTIPSGWQFLSGYGAGPPSGNGYAGSGPQPWGISEHSAPRPGRRRYALPSYTAPPAGWYLVEPNRIPDG